MSHEIHDNTPIRPAVILRFPRRRGRPRGIARARRDTGTPELVMKRLHSDTTEALDLFLERELISNEQHWCGIHLRWLYTLRHGAPGVRAIDPAHFGGRDIRPDDPDWRHARELEYHEAIGKLAATGHTALLLNLCVYNERPAFLSVPQTATRRLARNSLMLEFLREGLDVLVDLWKR
jgi:hypothetical protein